MKLQRHSQTLQVCEMLKEVKSVRLRAVNASSLLRILLIWLGSEAWKCVAFGSGALDVLPFFSVCRHSPGCACRCKKFARFWTNLHKVDDSSPNFQDRRSDGTARKLPPQRDHRHEAAAYVVDLADVRGLEMCRVSLLCA